MVHSAYKLPWNILRMKFKILSSICLTLPPFINCISQHRLSHAEVRNNPADHSLGRGIVLA